MSEKRVIFHNKPTKALTPQKKIGDDGFPFSLNPTIGCFLECKYCYLQGYPFNRHVEFGKEVKVKTWMPGKLDKELERLRDLPNHLKRVQVCQACEYYLAEVMSRTRSELNRDIMAEIFEIFENHWNAGNQWMVHVVTKSHLILRHLDILSRLRHMVQVELTLICLDEHTRREYEKYAPTMRKRLEAIQRLAEADVFVRVMAMPFTGSYDDALELRRVVFEHGARAFKHKGLNYFEDAAVKQGGARKSKARKDIIFKDLLIKSGERVIENGQARPVIVPMPPKGGVKMRWQGTLVDTERSIINSGYADLNDVNWGYVL